MFLPEKIKGLPSACCCVCLISLVPLLLLGVGRHGKSFPFLKKIQRGSYMSAHVLLNLLNELGKRDKMRGLPSNLSLLSNKFNKFNNTRAQC